MNYKIVSDEQALDDFIQRLPPHLDSEVYYLTMFGRHKYCQDFPNMRDDGQLSRFVSKKDQIKEKLLRLESPVGSYVRNDRIVPQEAIAIYICMNPKSLPKANRNLLVELAKRVADGDTNFNPISMATTEIHRAPSRKFFVDFDFDNVADRPALYVQVKNLFGSDDCFLFINTRGGVHVVVLLEKVRGMKINWYKTLADMEGCDVRGADSLTPIPGCFQGGYTPNIWRP